MNQAEWSVPDTYFGDPSYVRERDINPQDFSHSPVRISQSFINNLNVPVVLVMRSGLRFTLEPRLYTFANVLIARTEITVSQEASRDVSRFLSSVTDKSSPELQAIREAFQISFEHRDGMNGARIILDYPIQYSTLQGHGGTVYYSELDMVVSLLPIEQVCEHPYSQAGRDVSYANTLPLAVDGLDFNYALSIIDNTGKRGPMWLNVNGRVSKITPKKDNTRQDGIHLASNQVDEANTSRTSVKVQRYAFESARELGLFETHDEAMCLGDLKNMSRTKALELEEKIVLAKSERELVLLENKRELEEKVAKMEKERLELDAARRVADEESEMRRQRLKDVYEERSHVRKDSSESLKLLPNLVIGLGAVFIALATFMGSSKKKLTDWF